jgi:hypothetical protein
VHFEGKVKEMQRLRLEQLAGIWANWKHSFAHY